MNRVFACTDFHGIKNNYDQINKYIDSTDTVYFLGDAADRGAAGWEIIKDLINRPNWIWIPGNHDIMLANRIISPFARQIAEDHEYNGGSVTWKSVLKDKEVFGKDKIKEYGKYILSLPLFKIYENKVGKRIYMSHSGYIGIDEIDLLWDRSHFTYPISDYTDEKIDYVIHGHTPIFYLLYELSQTAIKNLSKPSAACAYWYCNNTKCNLDNLTAASGDTVLLDLDTFEEKLFHADTIDNQE